MDNPRATLLGAQDRHILNKMPKSLHTKAERAAGDLDGQAKKDVVAALEAFVETYQIKYERAADCLTKDRDALLAFYDFPAEHWNHLRTTNPIESTFAPSGIAPSGQRAACRTRPRLPWCSSLSNARRKIGAGSTATTSCQN